jgi:hypothetical protein
MSKFNDPLLFEEKGEEGEVLVYDRPLKGERW